MTKKSLTELKLARTIVKGGRGEFLLSIPKRLAELRSLEAGQVVEWKIRQDGKIEVTI